MHKKYPKIQTLIYLILICKPKLIIMIINRQFRKNKYKFVKPINNFIQKFLDHHSQDIYFMSQLTTGYLDVVKTNLDNLAFHSVRKKILLLKFLYMTSYTAI